MAVGIVGPKYTFTKRSKDKGLIKIIYSDFEPSKNYLWGKPDGTTWVWYKWNWVPYKGKGPVFARKDHGYHEDYITAEVLDNRIKAERYKIINDAIKAAEVSQCGSACDVQEYIETEIEPRIENLENYDHSAFVLAEDVD